jgi:hypothetical protein
MSQTTAEQIEQAKILVDFAEKELRSVCRALKKLNPKWVSPFDDQNNRQGDTYECV